MCARFFFAAVAFFGGGGLCLVCDARECVLGYDPLLTRGAPEVLTLTCTCSSTCSGTFTLALNGGRTQALSPSATAAEIEAAIEVRKLGDFTLLINFAFCTVGFLPRVFFYSLFEGCIPILFSSSSALGARFVQRLK